MHITITGLTGSDGKKVKACKDTINALIKLQVLCAVCCFTILHCTADR